MLNILKKLFNDITVNEKIIQLRAGKALLIYLGTLGGYSLGMVLGGTLCYICPGNLGFDIQQVEGLLGCFKAIRIHREVIGILISALIMLALSLFFVKNQLKNRSLTGAAWVLGERRMLVRGLLIGCLIASICVIASHGSEIEIYKYKDISPDLKLLSIIYSFIYITIVPAFEELLYRGIILGGVNYSFGPKYGCILTTILFISMHIPRIFISGIVMFGICSLAISALWIRLRAGAVGPAIAIHFAFNLIIFYTT